MFNWLFNSGLSDIIDRLFSGSSKKYLLYAFLWFLVAVASIGFMGASGEAIIASAANGNVSVKGLLLFVFIPLSLFSVGAAWYYFAKWRHQQDNSVIDVVTVERLKTGLPPLDDEEKRAHKL